MKWYIHINICKRMLIAALSVITNWKPPKYCQLVNKLWYIPTVEFYSAIKTTDKNKSAKRMNLLKRLCWTKEASTKDKIQYNSNIQLWNIYQTLTQAKLNYSDSRVVIPKSSREGYILLQRHEGTLSSGGLHEYITVRTQSIKKWVYFTELNYTSKMILKSKWKPFKK